MRPNMYVLLQRAIEEGAGYGLRHTAKYSDSEDVREFVDTAAIDGVVDAIMLALTEIFTFDEDEISGLGLPN